MPRAETPLQAVARVMKEKPDTLRARLYYYKVRISKMNAEQIAGAVTEHTGHKFTEAALARLSQPDQQPAAESSGAKKGNGHANGQAQVDPGKRLWLLAVALKRCERIARTRIYHGKYDELELDVCHAHLQAQRLIKGDQTLEIAPE